MQGINIKSVARLCGTSPHTLRAWEKRYQVISPQRSNGGQRLYSMADIDKLKLLSLLVDRGHAISTIARFSIKELSSLVKATNSTVAPSSSKLLSEHLNSLIAALRLLDFDELERQILKARVETTARIFILDIVSPLLSEVGRLVLNGTLDVAREHALSAILRNHLGELLSQVQKTTPRATTIQTEQTDLPSFLFATPEGDLHEFGILLASILTGTHGFRFRYLGPNMPADSLAKAATAIGANIIVIGSVQADSERLAHPLKKYVQLLSTQVKKNSYHKAAIWIGGFCDFDLSRKKSSIEFVHLNSLNAFEKKLEEILFKFKHQNREQK